jgi:hypothetical protein
MKPASCTYIGWYRDCRIKQLRQQEILQMGEMRNALRILGLCKLWNILNISKLFWRPEAIYQASTSTSNRDAAGAMIPLHSSTWLRYVEMAALEALYHTWNSMLRHFGLQSDKVWFWVPPTLVFWVSTCLFATAFTSRRKWRGNPRRQRGQFDGIDTDWTGVQWASLSKDVLFLSGFYFADLK